MQAFKGVVRPLGETRPAWKVLRVLGNLLGLAGFDHDSAEDVKREALGEADIAGKLGNHVEECNARFHRAGAGRRAPAHCGGADLRGGCDRAPRACAAAHAGRRAPGCLDEPGALFEKLGLREGDGVRVRQGGGEALLAAGIDDKLPADCVRLAAARPETATLGAMFGEVTARTH